MAARIVLLNGVSSSGKTALAKELQRRLPTPWLQIGVDDIGAMRSVEATARLSPVELAEVLRRTRSGFHHAVAGLARAGNDVIADHVLSEPWRLAECLDLWAPFDVVFVGVHASSEELERRERHRADRPLGLAVEQLRTVHAHGCYDVEVDTTDTADTADTAAFSGAVDAVVDRVVSGAPGQAFPDLRAGAETASEVPTDLPRGGATASPELRRVLDALAARSVPVWVAGGWGVDALVGHQTRPHRDVDLLVVADRLPAALAVTAELGYTVETDWLPVRVEVAAPGLGRVDLHPVVFDADGNGVQAGLDGAEFHYPAACSWSAPSPVCRSAA